MASTIDSGLQHATNTAPAPTPEAKKQPVVCVFCGASDGTTPVHLEAARALATAFHQHGIKLVYGGGTVGIMGEVAKTLVSLSGPDAVHGVIPRALLSFERAPNGVPQGGEMDEVDVKGLIDENVYGRMTVVEDMHTRKHLMASQVIEGGPGSGFVALSGGYGTLEELAEMVTWNQLGIHARAVVVFNVGGFWDGLLQWVKTAVESGFVQRGNAGIMAEATTAEQVIQQLTEYQVAEGRFKLKWGQK